MRLTLILGNQLFPIAYYEDFPKAVFMCEDRNLCEHFRYHKHKIMFFLVSMRRYRDELKQRGFRPRYHKLAAKAQFFNLLGELVEKEKIREIHSFEIEDKFFEKQVQDFCGQRGISLVFKNTPMFMVSREKFREYIGDVSRPYMKTFYERQRVKKNVLMSKDGKPKGGHFSFDSSNRKKIPLKSETPHAKLEHRHDKYVKEVGELVETNFAGNPGHTENFWLATSRRSALSVLDKFIKERLELFGDYQDALDERDPFLYHSVISPYLNIGFLTPEEVVKRVEESDVRLNSKEGFIRQVMGWREFVRGIYQNYELELEKRNFFGHQRKLTEKWYTGETGLPPLDLAIKKASQLGYCHHIERLMVLSNAMLLCEVEPRQAYSWFMEMFVDSSDWVMAPNVFGMGLFSDGGIFATKPYISGSNYLLKMGHYEKGDWTDIMDGLYWRFIEKNKKFFEGQPRLSMALRTLERMDLHRKRRIYKAARLFIESVTEGGSVD